MCIYTGVDEHLDYVQVSVPARLGKQVEVNIEFVQDWGFSHQKAEYVLVPERCCMVQGGMSAECKNEHNVA